MDYLYDNTFEGLLTALYNHFNIQETSGIFPKDSYQISLMNPCKEIITSEDNSRYLYSKIKNELSIDVLKNVYHCFLSDNIKRETLILNYLNLGFKKGRIFNLYHTHPDVHPILDINKKVQNETHRYLGYVRFKDLANFLYSEINPQYNILPLIAYHFADRFNNESFIIHDAKRNQAIVCRGGKWIISPFYKDPTINKQSDIYELLWKKYFKTVAIENRKNLKLQQNFVPLKYRKDLLEFENSD